MQVRGDICVGRKHYHDQDILNIELPVAARGYNHYCGQFGPGGELGWRFCFEAPEAIEVNNGEVIFAGITALHDFIEWREQHKR